MTRLTEGHVAFVFPADWLVIKYDESTFFRRRFQGVANSKAVDFVAMSPASDELWLLEAKDYTIEPRDRTKEPLEVEVAKKSRDTLAGLFALGCNPSGDERDEDRLAQRARRATKLRVVLHLEQPPTQTRLYPSLLDRADVQARLRKQVRGIDPRPMVVSSQDMPGVPWSAHWAP